MADYTNRIAVRNLASVHPQFRREEYSGDIICTAVRVISTKESEWLICYVSSWITVIIFWRI